MDHFYRIWQWIGKLSPQQGAIVSGASVALIAAFGKNVLFPALRSLFRFALRLIYPLLCSAIFLDRWWGLRNYRRTLSEDLSRLRNPWLEEGQKLEEVFIPVSSVATTAGAERADIRDALDRYRFVVILGEP